MRAVNARRFPRPYRSVSESRRIDAGRLPKNAALRSPTLESAVSRTAVSRTLRYYGLFAGAAYCVFIPFLIPATLDIGVVVDSDGVDLCGTSRRPRRSSLFGFVQSTPAPTVGRSRSARCARGGTPLVACVERHAARRCHRLLARALRGVGHDLRDDRVEARSGSSVSDRVRGHHQGHRQCDPRGFVAGDDDHRRRVQCGIRHRAVRTRRVRAEHCGHTRPQLRRRNRPRRADRCDPCAVGRTRARASDHPRRDHVHSARGLARPGVARTPLSCNRNAGRTG